MAVKTEPSTGIRPFTVDVPQAEIEVLRERIASTRWPEKETVADQSQGVPFATMQALARYWASEYEWRRFEAKLNSFPQFMTEIDGLDIHFIHVRSKHGNALPLILTHGWPGSIVEMLNVIGPLTDPTAYGGSADDAFHVVIPSLPGFGFSGKPTAPGWNPEHIAQAWVELMKRLGYQQFVAQGGDWGAIIVDVMGVSVPAAVSVFPRELYQARRSWTEQAYQNLIYFNEVDKGNHFAAWQEPDLFATEVRAGFRSLR